MTNEPVTKGAEKEHGKTHVGEPKVPAKAGAVSLHADTADPEGGRGAAGPEHDKMSRSRPMSAIQGWTSRYCYGCCRYRRSALEVSDEV